MGQMRFRVEGDPRSREPVLAQLLISHPNHSGLAMDQYTRQYTPAHYVRRIEISQGTKPLLTADVDFSFSENPSLRFWFVPREGSDLRATVIDSQDLRFVGAQALSARP
jgi:sulfur-oxidizing protein SoxY